MRLRFAVAVAMLSGSTVALAPPLLAPASASPVPAAYQITDISLPGAFTSRGVGINDDGVAVIAAAHPDTMRSAAYRLTDGGWQLLEVSSRPYAVNGSGDVVGDGVDGRSHVWLGSSAASARASARAQLFDISDDGVAVGTGYGYAPNASAVTFATDGEVTVLPLPEGADRTQALARNEAGVVVGTVEAFGTYDEATDQTTGSYHEAVMWDATGNPTILTSVGDTGTAYALDVNESGDVLVDVNQDNNSEEFIRSADGTSTTVTGLGGFVDPARMNDLGQVVGRASYQPGGDGQTAFVFDAATGTTVDLFTRIPANSGWTQLIRAEDINNAGQIVGYGTKDGEPRAFLLTPVTGDTGSASGTVTNGGTLTTDPTGQGATSSVAVQTSINAPSSVSGTLSATLQTTSTAAPAGFSLFEREVAIEGPPAAADDPYRVTFTVDSTLLGGSLAGDVEVFRDGVLVAPCSGPVAAAPDPCVASRSTSGDDVLIGVRTSHFSVWSLGRPAYTVSGPFGSVAPPPTINTAVAGAAIPVSFTLGGNRGLEVFRAGYPKTSTFACDSTTKGKAVKTTVKASSSSLTYNAKTATYKYVWKSPDGLRGCVALDMVFRDGSSIRTLFRLR